MIPMLEDYYEVEDPDCCFTCSHVDTQIGGELIRSD